MRGAAGFRTAGLTVELGYWRLPKRLVPRALALLPGFLERVADDIPLTGYASIIRRVGALAHTLTTSGKTEIDAAQRMSEWLAYVRILLANNALIDGTGLERATLDWVGAHLMSPDPFQQAFATAIAGWIRELP
jgi:hypothetical protein